MKMFFLLCEFAFIIMTAFGSASLTFFIDYIIGSPSNDELNPGRIFSRVGLWLVNKHDEFERKESIRVSEKIDCENEHKLQNIKFFYRRNIWKMFGACIICFNVWVSTLCGIAFFIIFNLNWWFFLFYLVLSNMFLRRILNH